MMQFFPKIKYLICDHLAVTEITRSNCYIWLFKKYIIFINIIL